MKIFINEENSCGLNYQPYLISYELSEHFEITQNVSEADIIIIANTCSCTEQHLLHTLNYIASIIENKKETAKIYLTGCITRKFIDHPLLSEIEEWLQTNIDFIIPQNQPNLLLKLISENTFKHKDINEFGMVQLHPHNRATIFISNGCLNNCAFCKVTYQPYPLKSANLNDIKEEIDYLNENDISQIWISGTNICQYGLDNYHSYMLPEIINYLEEKDNIKEAHLVGFAFKDAIKNNFQDVLKYSTKVTTISGSLETGSDRLLKLIRKGFTSEEIIKFAENIRQFHHKDLDLCIMAGLPTETMKDIKITLNVIKKLQPLSVEITSYVNSQFVDSNQFLQVNSIVRQNRAQIYRRALKKQNINATINK